MITQRLNTYLLAQKNCTYTVLKLFIEDDYFARFENQLSKIQQVKHQLKNIPKKYTKKTNNPQEIILIKELIEKKENQANAELLTILPFNLEFINKIDQIELKKYMLRTLRPSGNMIKVIELLYSICYPFDFEFNINPIEVTRLRLRETDINKKLLLRSIIIIDKYS